MSPSRTSVRPPREGERASLLSLAVATERFTMPEAEGLLGGLLDAYSQGGLGDGHIVVVAANPDTGAAQGWSYFAPDPYADGVWNLWWIGTHPDAHGTGVGTALLHVVEDHVRQHGARVLVIETSDQDGLARARRFYEREGYTARGTIPDYYAPGDGKVIFSKSFASM